MLTRALSRRLFPLEVTYTLLDGSPDNTRYANIHLTNWAQSNGWQVDFPQHDQLILHRDEQIITVHLVTEDIHSFSQTTSATYDLLIANAFLDLLPLQPTVDMLFDLTKPNGYFYFSINFDGLTLLDPQLDPALDAAIQSAYHQTMEDRRFNRQPTGGAHAGRKLCSILSTAGGNLLAAGSSDWVVHPIDGRYPQDEAYFLHFIIETIANALKHAPHLNQRQLTAWVASRHQQIDAGGLIYIAHQLDYFGRTPP